MRAVARRVARCVREATAAASGPAPQLRRLLAPESSPRSSRAPVRWLASAVPPDGFARRGYGRGRGRGGDTRRADDARASNLHLRDVQRAIVDAPDVQTILDLCDPATVARFSSVNVATALSKMAKRAQRPATETRGPARRARLGEHPAFAALCDRAAQLISRDAFPHRAVCNSAHALAALQHRGHARVTAQFVGGGALDAPASAAWRALRGAMPTVDDACAASKQEEWKEWKERKESARGRIDAYEQYVTDVPVSARQSTMFLYASALARDPPSAGVLRGVWRDLRAAESRVGAHHVSNLVWALGTLGLDPGPEGWEIVNRRAPFAFRERSTFNAQNVANTWWGFAKLRRAPRGEAAAALSRAIVVVADTFKPQELANAMWARAYLASACGLRVEPSVRAAFDDAVARTLDVQEKTRRRVFNAAGATDETSALGVSTPSVETLRFKSKELSQVFWHYASLNVKPRDALWRSLDAAAEAQAPFASPMDVSLTLWACATLGKPPSPRAWAAMERRMRALVAGGHVGSGPGTTATKGFAPLSSKTSKTGDGDGDANRRARAGHVLVEWQQVANLVWSYAKLRTMPDAATLGAIRDAAARLALEKPTEMTPQDASMLLWGHVTLGTLVAPQSASGRASVADADASDAADRDRDRDPDPDPALSALFSALERHADAFKPDELTNALWCLAVARGVGDLRGASLPVGAYARMWRRLATMDAGDFATEDGVLIAHHAAVTHNALIAESDDEDARREARAAFPEGLPAMRPSLVAAARRAWRTQNEQHARDDAVSSSQRRVGSLLRRAGIEHESERELLGGYGFFPATQTVDFFIPETRVVVEYDGPHHFYESAADPRRERFFRETRETLSPVSPVSRSATRNDGADANRDVVDATREDPGATRNVNTRLRDALLFKKRGVRAVVTVPWYAMRGVKHADQLEWLLARIAKESVPRERPAQTERETAETGETGETAETAETAEALATREAREALISRWLAASPASSRARLERAAAGKARDARWDAVVAAARKDKTKVRTVLRGEIVEAAERTSRSASRSASTRPR